MPDATVMAALTAKVIARFADELAEASAQGDTRQLEHLAQRAEARYITNLGETMRALVDAERAARVGGAR